MLRLIVPVITELVTSLLANRDEILEAYLFGSVARGDNTPHSDVDVAVYVDPAKIPDTPFGYDAALATALITHLGRNDVDVVILNRAGPLVYHRVVRDGLRLVAKDLAATTTREGQAMSRYFDYAQQLRKADRALAERLASGSFGR